MTYKETLFFVAKCLTISLKEKNREEIERKLQSEEIDWDAVVKVSTGHYVFPALYCNLKRVDFLKYVPADLVEYMKYITNLNRERNVLIIEQAKELNQLLLANNIIPIFLKGTGNLLEGLYDDIAERMVGDIDIIIDKANVKKSNNILIQNGYISNFDLYDGHRHLSRIVKKNKIAAVEIHKEFLEKPNRTFFNYNIIQYFKLKNNIHVLSMIDKLALTILSNQINDNAFKKANISLRSFYDFMILNNNNNNNNLIIKYSHFQKIIQSYFSVFNFLFIPDFNFSKKSIIVFQVKKVDWLLNNPKIANIYFKYINLSSYLSVSFFILIKSFYSKSYFKFTISRLVSIDWYKRRFLRN